MADYISRYAAIYALDKEYRYGADIDRCGLAKAFKAIESLEPADVAPVVRCKECKYWDPGYPTYYGDDFIVPKCGKYQQMVGYSSDDFCSYGERREE